MDRQRQNDNNLGVNKSGKSIRKSPLHQPNFTANANATAPGVRPQVQPQVYNISKNDFRSVVQQLTGSPSRESLPRPPPQNNNSPRAPNTRLQRVRPAPLTEIRRPSLPLPTMPHSFLRPPTPQQPFPQGTQQQQAVMGQGDQLWSSTAESPISEYMRYLQSSFGDPGPSGNQMQPGHEHRPYMPVQPQTQPPPYMPAQPQSQPQSYMPEQQSSQPQPQPHMMSGSQPRTNMEGSLQPSQYLPPPGLVPSPAPRNLPFPQFNGPVPGTPTLPSPRFSQMYGGFPSPRYNSGFPSPRYNGGFPSPRYNGGFPSPRYNGGFPSPRYNGFGPLHSPASQFVQPSPTSYPNMFPPRSPYPLLSPGVQYPQPLTPNFSFSQIAQSGSHRPGAGPSQPPPSPGLMFPLSPSGYFPSPRWGNY